jgi:hypothetical protein
MKFLHLPHLIVASLVLVLLPSCSLLRPPAPVVSEFLKGEPKLLPARKTSPFALVGGQVPSESKKLYIAPVSLAHLRGPNKWLTKKDDLEKRSKAAIELAGFAKTRFAQAFQHSDAPRYSLVDAPVKDGLTLKLAITELNRNTLGGSVSRLAVRAVRVPGLNLLMNRPTRGLKASIAIEGMLVSNKTGKVLYQFADLAESKLALLPVTDFMAYGQGREAIRQWATRFEKVTRATPGQRLRGISPVSFF